MITTTTRRTPFLPISMKFDICLVNTIFKKPRKKLQLSTRRRNGSSIFVNVDLLRILPFKNIKSGFTAQLQVRSIHGINGLVDSREGVYRRQMKHPRLGNDECINGSQTCTPGSISIHHGCKKGIFLVRKHVLRMENVVVCESKKNYLFPWKRKKVMNQRFIKEVCFLHFERRVKVEVKKRFPSGALFLLTDEQNNKNKRPPLTLSSTTQLNHFELVHPEEWPPEGWNSSAERLTQGVPFPVNHFSPISITLHGTMKHIMNPSKHVRIVSIGDGEVLLYSQGIQLHLHTTMGLDSWYNITNSPRGWTTMELRITIDRDNNKWDVSVYIENQRVLHQVNTMRRNGSWSSLPSCQGILQDPHCKGYYKECMNDFSYQPRTDQVELGTFSIRPII